MSSSAATLAASKSALSASDTSSSFRFVLVFWVVTAGIYFVAATVVQPDQLSRSLLLGGTFCLVSLTLLPLDRWRPKLARFGFLGLIWLVVTFAAATAGGPGAPALIVFLLMVWAGAIFFGAAGGWAVVSIAAVTELVLTVLAMRGDLPEPAKAGGLVADWLRDIFFLVMACALQITSSRSLKKALTKTEDELARRRRTEARLLAVQQRFQLASEAAGVGYWEWDLESGFVECDSVIKKLYQLPDDSRGFSIEEWRRRVHPADRPGQVKWLEQALEGYDLGLREFRICGPDGSIRYIQAAEAVVRNEEGKPVCMVGVNYDVTAQHETEQALLEAEELYVRLFRASPDGMSLSDFHTGEILEVNDGYLSLFGFAREDVVGRSSFELGLWADSSDRARVVKGIETNGFFRNELVKGRHRDGRHLLILLSAESLSLNDRRCLLIVCHDITEWERAKVEKQQALERESRARQAFTDELIESQEAERCRIAGELHDSVGQNLLLIKNRIALVRMEKAMTESVSEQLEAVAELADLSVEEVRQMAHDLRPHQLDHLGLTRALTALVERANGAAPLELKARVEPVDDLFDSRATTNFYRIVQEAVNNVIKHSGARWARVSIERDLHETVLVVEDDGHGYPAEVLSGESNGGFGLTNINERTRMLNGKLELGLRPEGGSYLRVAIPDEMSQDGKITATTFSDAIGGDPMDS